MQFYADLSKNLGWTPEQIDRQDMGIILDYVVAATKEEEKQGLYIDEIGM